MSYSYELFRLVDDLNYKIAKEKALSENSSFNVELPGFSKEDVEITVSNDYLTVKAEKKDPNYTAKLNSITKSFKILNSVNLEDISAVMNNGLLTITLKQKENLIKKIEVK